MQKHKIALGMISNDHKVHWGIVASLLQMLSRGEAKYEFTPVFQKGLYLDKLRNGVAGEFMLSTDCKYLLFVDYDNGFHPDTLDLFMEDMEKPGVHIVSGKYFFKNKDMMMVAGFRHESCQEGFYKFIPEGGISGDLVNISKMGLTGAMVGCGCLMISRYALENISYPWFQTPWESYYTPHNDSRVGWSMTGEDAFFCRLAEKHGFDIYLDQRIRSPHYKGEKCYPKEWDQIPIKEE